MRIATFQRRPILDDIGRLCDVLNRDLGWATAEGIDMALFPEGFLLGHSYDPSEIATRAEEIASQALDALCTRLRTATPTLIIGGFEKRAGTVTNNAFVIEQGKVVGRYAKAYPNEPGGERRNRLYHL
jgi:5-aminopentanamidase